MNHGEISLLLNRALLFCFVLIVGITLLSSGMLCGQEPEYRQFGVREGLNSKNWNLQVMSDSKGYLWIASNSGLTRYDGQQFRKYGFKDGLPDIFIVHLFEGPDQRIWASTFAGDLVYVSGDSIKVYKHSDQFKRFAKRHSAWTWSVDEDLNIVVGSVYPGVIRIDSSGNIDTLISALPGQFGLGVWLRDSLPSMVFRIANRGEAKPQKRIFVYNEARELVASVLVKEQRKEVPLRGFITKCRDGSVALTYGNDIYRLSMNGLEAYLRQDVIHNSIMEDSKGNLWTSTYGLGMTMYPKGILDSTSLKHYYRDKIFHWAIEDKEGSLWLGTNQSGVLQVPRPHVLHSDSNNSSLAESDFEDISASSENLYGATAYRRVYKWSAGAKTEVFNWYEELKRPVRGGAIRSVLWDHNTQRLYMAFSNAICYQTAEGQLKTLSFPDSITKVGFVTKLNFDHDSSTVLVVAKYDIFRVEGDSIVEAISMQGKDVVRAVCEDEHGDLWIGGDKGLWRATAKGLKKVKETVFTGRIEDITFFKNRLWINDQEQGLVTVQGDRMNFISRQFQNAWIHHFRSEKDTLWATGHSHLYKMVVSDDAELAVSRMFINVDGVFPLGAVEILGDSFFLCSEAGLFQVHRKHLDFSLTVPAVSIQSVRINDADTQVLAGYELHHDQNYLRIGYIGTSFRLQDVSYRYRMQGVENEWQYTDQRTVQYTKMPPGDYIFEVQARSSDFVWSASSALVFTIVPPFWATSWFLACVIVLLLLLIALFVQWRLQRLRDRQRNEQRLLRLESQALRAQMNPHFIFNVLSAIQGYVSNGDAAASEVYLGKFSRLIRKILENSRASFVPLREELETIRYYMGMEQMRFKVAFHFEINLDPAIDDENVFVPPMLIQPYLENAILHGIVAKGEQGRIELNINQVGDLLKCEIIDNGVGRKHSAEFKVDQKLHKPLGMLITRERLELLQHKAAEKLEVVTEDLLDQASRSCGTRVSISIPVRSEL